MKYFHTSHHGCVLIWIVPVPDQSWLSLSCARNVLTGCLNISLESWEVCGVLVLCNHYAGTTLDMQYYFHFYMKMLIIYLFASSDNTRKFTKSVYIVKKI
ncbi:hypothetical protein AMECASPLE_003981 [Ameca splendens]|uniref:Uncharacterized protein n=1 Tax=Ameca splendens TaxID=208324 RepID=A0ABV0XBT0_9TELE